MPLKGRDLFDPAKRPLMQAVTEIQQANQMGPKNLSKDVKALQAAAKTSRTRNNLKQIAIAFHNHHDYYRKLPGTANIKPSDEKKMYPYSWRVAILPALDHDDLYKQYRFDEPWDSEHNLTLLNKMPEIYRSPFAKETQKPGDTNYQGFAGEQTALGTGDGVSFRDMRDGTSNTLLVLDSGETVPWTKPADLPFPAPPGQKWVFSREELPYVTADGAVHSLAIKDLDQLSALITRNGGEPKVRTEQGSFGPAKPAPPIPSEPPRISN
jgi:hypothetical protein